MKRKMAIIVCVCIAACAARGGMLEGTITRANTGEPLAGALIVARGDVLSVSATADVDGKFCLTGVDLAQGHELVVSAEGCATALVAVPRGPSTPLRISLQREGVLEGRVVEAASDTAVAGATVEIVREAIGVERVLADASGAFRIGGLGNERLRLRAHGNGWFMPDARPLQVQVKIGRVVSCSALRLEPGASARLRVVDAETGEPIRLARLWWTDAPLGMADAMDIVAASPLVTPLPPRGAVGIVGATGFVDRRLTISPAAGGRATTVEIALRPMCEVSMALADSAGRPVGGARVRFSNRVRDHFSGQSQHTVVASNTG